MTSVAAAEPRSDPGRLAPVLPPARARVGVVVALLAAAGAAWWSTADRMAGMDAGPGTSLGTVGWFTGAWAVMTAAMMLPSLAPTAAVYAALTRRRDPSPWLALTGGYLLVWSAAGLLAYGLFALGDSTLHRELAWHAGGRWLAAGVLAAAALYEVTPLKGACLIRCRSPFRFLRVSWSRGWSGAFATGVRNGVWCVGSSWALMAALFALGVMSLTWMALLAALVALEKVGPWPRAATAGAAAVLVGLAVAILVAPHEVPGLVVPGSSSAMPGMVMRP